MTCAKEHGATLLRSILDNHKIDWQGIRERKPDATWAGALVPVIRKDSELYALAHSEALALKIGMTPVLPAQMAALLHTLHGHYWQQGMSPALMKEVVKDYLRLLAHYPLDIFEQVRDELLLEPARKFVPTIGELNALLEKKLSQKKSRLQRVIKLLETAE
jgi:hypothetical protein